MEKINISEIKELFRLAIERLESDNITEVDIDADEYWIVLTHEWDNFKKNPELGVGSLKEDLGYLKIAIEENAMYSYSNFDRLASLLRAISEMQAPSK